MVEQDHLNHLQPLLLAGGLKASGTNPLRKHGHKHAAGDEIVFRQALLLLLLGQENICKSSDTLNSKFQAVDKIQDRSGDPQNETKNCS